MDASKFLAKVLGLYLLILSLFMLTNITEFTNNIQNLLNNPSLMFVVGFFTLIIGLLMIVAHNVWLWNWRLMITLMAWLVFLKGVNIIFHPQFIDKITLLFIQNQRAAYITAIIDGILGLILCYFGFKSEKNLHQQ